MLVCVNVINGVINHYITITLSPAEAGDLNAYFEVAVPVARKRYVSGQGFLFKKLSTQSLYIRGLQLAARGPPAAREGYFTKYNAL